MIYFANNMDFNANLQKDVDLYTGRSKLLTDSIFFASGHGGATYQNLSDYDYIVTEFFTDTTQAYYIGANALKKLQLVVYNGCETGLNGVDSHGDTVNLVGLTYQRGAHNVIGTQQTVYSPDNSKWGQSLFTSLSVGYTLGEAREFADENLFETSENSFYGNANSRYGLGDNSFLFNLPAYPAASNTSSSSSVESLYESIGDFYTGKYNDHVCALIDEDDGLQQLSLGGTSLDDQAYNVYRDTFNNLYIVSPDSNVLATYIPDTQSLQLGDAIVDSQAALQQANAFLSSAGYDVSDFTLTHSNDFSKRFQITYQYRIDEVDTTEKMHLYFEAEADGTVHLVRFSVYDYGAFSGQDAPAVSSNDYSLLSASLKQTAAAKGCGETYTLSEPIWVRNDSGHVQLRASMEWTDMQGNLVAQSVYSTIL